MTQDFKFPISELTFDLEAAWYDTFREWFFKDTFPEEVGIFTPRRQKDLMNWLMEHGVERNITVFWEDLANYHEGAAEPDNVYGIVVEGWHTIRGEPSDTGALHTLLISMDLSYLGTSAYPILNRLEMFFKAVNEELVK